MNKAAGECANWVLTVERIAKTVIKLKSKIAKAKEEGFTFTDDQ